MDRTILSLFKGNEPIFGLCILIGYVGVKLLWKNAKFLTFFVENLRSSKFLRIIIARPAKLDPETLI